MIDPEEWPELDSVEFKTRVDAQKCWKWFAALMADYEMMNLRLIKQQQEMEAMWEHIRNLEYHLLASGNKLNEEHKPEVYYLPSITNY